MFSGGLQISRAEKGKLDDLGEKAGEIAGQLSDIKGEMEPMYSDLSAEKDTLSDLTGEKSDKSNDYSKKAEDYTDKKADADRARTDHRTEKQEAEREKQRVRNKEEARTAYERKKEDKARAIATNENELAILKRRAQFLRETYYTEVNNQYEMACLQGICENMNASGAILLSFHAASMRLNAAGIPDVNTNVSAALNKPTYLNIAVERVKPTTHLQAENDVRGQESRVADAKKQLGEMAADKYHDQDLAQAKIDHAREVGERDQAKAKFDKDDATAKAAKKAREGSRVAFRDAEKAERDRQRLINEAQDKIRRKQHEADQKQAELATNGRERQKITDKAMVKT